MTTSALLLVFSTFLACAVEAVEALTVILAVGVTRGWRAAMLGAITATFVLIAFVLAFGPALSRVPLDALRVVVGAALLIFGMGWLRKAILRASGFKALRDEAALYQKRLEEGRRTTATAPVAMDWYGFTLVFKSVFLEGLEVAFIVLTVGTAQHSIPLAGLGAALALAVVGLVGALVHAPLSRVPENSMKFAVGLLLSSFGIFWSVEGTGARWPAEDLSILGILAVLTVAALALVSLLRHARARRAQVEMRKGT
ncbi:MAG: hypothetical protein ABI488_03885 [Polyangiaceae bacterium]